ncbi:MAG: hypothetical protein FJ303_26000 [Planctomycetes bacterium]|nr:hypothetical protein [Planctomycetota bacterium]
MTDLVTKIAKLKYAPGKRAIYDTVFYWFGFDDTMTAHPRLFVVKNILEKQLNSRTLVACGDLRDVKVRSLVLLTNRKELAADPKAEPKYTALLHVETNTRFYAEGSDERKRKEIAAKLKLPAECVGLTWRIASNGFVVCNVDARVDTQPAYFLMWQVCEFLRHNYDANDDCFLRWAVEHRRLSRGLASELIPQLFPPVKRPDPAIHYRDAEYLAVKIFAHYGLDKLQQFTYDKPGSFKPLIDAGVFSKEDAAKIALHEFKRFSFSKNVAFSRRYELSLHYMIEEDHHSTTTGFNHLGRIVNDRKETDTSSDIPADVKLMWSVDKEGRSPQEAIEAASRVFNTVKLEGLPRDKVVKLIGDVSHRPKGIYNFPFWPTGKGEMVCRFDTGAYGWQFNIRFNDKDICTNVTRKWIH